LEIKSATAPDPPAHALGTFALYAHDGPDHDWLRGQHLGSTVRLTPPMMAANVINALVVAWTLARWDDPVMIGWLSTVAVIALLAMKAWLRSRGRPASRASRRAMRRSTWHAAALGLVWALVPALWFEQASDEVQLLIAVLTTGMTAAGAFALARLPAASLVYTASLTVGSLIALWQNGGILAAPVSVLMLVYAWICATGAMATGRHATQLLLAKRDAQRQQQLLSVLLHDFEEHAAEGLWETDPAGCLRYVSPRAAELFGMEPAQLHGQTMPALLAPRSPLHVKTLGNAFVRGLPFRNLAMELDAEGAASRWWTISAKPARDDAGQPDGWRGVIVDVTEEVLAQDRMRHLAHFDSLTGLANRVTLRAELEHTLKRGDAAALLAIDVDRFKAINDTHGHSAGDGLLKTVGQRLRDCVRPQDLVARLGGDEFAVLIRSDTSREGLTAIANRLATAFATPCEMGGLQLAVAVSAGIALVPPDGGIDDWMGNADLALYRAKADGRARAVIYDPALGEAARRHSAIEEALRHAVERGQLALHLQPKLSVASGTVVGFEALLRWRHPVLGSISPGEFIPIAERTGHIQALGNWVLHEACHLAARRLNGLNVAVNVSPAQLRSQDFEQQVSQAIAATGLPPERLELEITESLFIDDPNEAVRRLSALRRLGVRIALDDFGAGYSSLGYLRQFHFDLLKIDRQFVGELMTREDARAIVGTIVSLARTLGMRTVAEGVETEAQRQALTRLGCDELQGYLIARPVPLEEWPQAIAQAAAAVRPG
jgi:diguanylate cyclase (GGDEF)-like protein/PAS domain S-box-containing protein